MLCQLLKIREISDSSVILNYYGISSSYIFWSFCGDYFYFRFIIRKSVSSLGTITRKAGSFWAITGKVSGF